MSRLRCEQRLDSSHWSGWGDLNSRSLGPQPSALDQTKPQPVKGKSYSDASTRRSVMSVRETLPAGRRGDNLHVAAIGNERA
jgi:hypothetical protein